MEFLIELSGIEFENLCFTLIQKMGFTVETTAISGDGGIDLIATSNQPLFKGKYIIQCKRYSGSVGVSIIRDLYGVVAAERANKGILITTGQFTASAASFAEDKNIELIDGSQLSVLLCDYKLDKHSNTEEHHFLRNPLFDTKRYEFYKSLLSRKDCPQEMYSKFLFEFLYPYFESNNAELIYNGLADEFLRSFDVFASRFFSKGKNEQIILPYYNRKYKGIAQLYKFDLFEYVQERIEILKYPEWIDLWVNIEPYTNKYFKLDAVPEDILPQVVEAARNKDRTKIKFRYTYRYCEVLNLLSLGFYFAIPSDYIWNNLSKNHAIEILVAEPHFDIVLSNTMYGGETQNAIIFSPTIDIIHAKQTLLGYVHSDKDIIIDTHYNRYIDLTPYFERYAMLNKEKIAYEIDKINMLFEII